jgi:hypothetical protein
MTAVGRFCVSILGAFFMTASRPIDGTPPDPLQGPDFVMEKVASWLERPGGADAELVLEDGSSWKLKPGTRMYSVLRDAIAAAVKSKNELLVSGDKRRGIVEIVLDTQRLATQEISSKEINGRYSVLFQGPPSVYYLRTGRPWSAQALSLLRQSASSGASFSSPDLVVALDPRNSEIVAVKPLARNAAATP